MKYLAFIVCIGTVFLSHVATAQSEVAPAVESELEQLCRTVLCRPPAPIRLKLPGGESFEMTPTSPTPIVAGRLITVYPGETVNIQATAEAGRLVDLTAVSEISLPDRTLVFHLKQEPTIGDGTGMMLEVESPFTGVLKYRLGMMLPSGDDLLKTSACPLRGGMASIEHWPHPIFQIVATDFRFVDPESKAATTCE